MATTIAPPATTIATVTPEGLALTPEAMANLKLSRGSQVSITIHRHNLPALHPEAERLAAETIGMFAHGRSLSEALKEWRQQEEQNARW